MIGELELDAPAEPAPNADGRELPPQRPEIPLRRLSSSITA
jgi:hypothetical protein